MSGVDRISELPEALLTLILSYLPTKESVQTCVLSTRWKNLYLSVPGLDLDYSVSPYDDDTDEEGVLSCFDRFFKFSPQSSFIDKLLEFSPESRLFKVKLKSRPSMKIFRDEIGRMINRGTQHLDVEISLSDVEKEYGCAYFLPMILYTIRTLIYLKITSWGVAVDPASVFMPCLRFMHLDEVKLHGPFEEFLSGCPVLEELTLVRDESYYQEIPDEFGVMCVRSQSLKRFHVLPHKNGRDAPVLVYMNLGEDQFDNIVVKNLTSLLMVELDIEFGAIFNPLNLANSNEIRDFLKGISSVRHMIISAKTVKSLECYSQAEVIPKFNNLSRLQAVFHTNLLQFLPAFLRCCPNLKHLALKVVHSEEMEDGLELIDVPRCVSTTLECVEIQEKLEWEEGKMKATSYFLGNSAVLKTLILSPTAYNPRDVVESEIWEMVNKLTRRSTGCEIIIRAMEEEVVII